MQRELPGVQEVRFLGRFLHQFFLNLYRTLYQGRDFLRSMEAGIVGLFLVQAVRYLYATLYARASSADLVQRASSQALTGQPGIVEIETIQREIMVLGVLLLLPLLAVIIGRWRISFPLTVLMVTFGRAAAVQTPDLRVTATSLVVGAGLLYLALMIQQRPSIFPASLLVGFTLEQLIRAYGDTMDHSWDSSYPVSLFNRIDTEVGMLLSLVSIGLIALSLLVWFIENDERKRQGPAPRGFLNLWGGLALGGILYLEFILLALPNTVAHWAEADYNGIVPLIIAATALPLVPEVRDIARRFAGMFDGAWRGWLWVLLLGLLLVVGRRYNGILAGLALVFAQFMVGLTLWWIYQVEGATPPRRRRSQEEDDRRRFRLLRRIAELRHPLTRPFRGHNLTGLGVIFGTAAFLVLAVGDYFTYDYAYVRDLSDPYENVSEVLRSFRNMGLGLALIAALLLSIPMILARRRIPWRGGSTGATLMTLVLVLGASYGGAMVGSSDAVRRPINPDCLRIVTFNIHGGYSQFFDPNLEQVAELIELNGADVVLLQEVDTGRMASAGVDQALWLARRLNMEWEFFPQNEAMQGLAVLSRVPIAEVDSALLVSEGNQAAAQHIMLNPDEGDPQAADLGYLHIYNTWLGFRMAARDGQPVPEDQQDQTRQLNALLGWVLARPNARPTDRVVLGGTFNFGPDSPLYQRPQDMGFVDPLAGLRTEEAMTVFLVNGTTARFDYLWTGNLPLIGAMVDQSSLAADTSDHRSALISVARTSSIQCPP